MSVSEIQRSYELPTRLNRDQLEARDVDLEGCYLVKGGPGTGKSILALLRAIKLDREGIDYLFLAYNRTLIQSSLQLSNTLLNSPLKCEQWQSWFWHFYKNTLNSPIQSQAGGNNLDWDWHDIEKKIEENFDKFEQQSKPYLIIDEGQDMPPEFYCALLSIGFENIYVVADQNQQLNATKNSSLIDICDSLAIDKENIYELRQNYRNQYAVARIAQEFYSDKTTAKPDLPERKESFERSGYWNYSNFNRVIAWILNLATNDRSKLIGVICPNNKVRQKYYHRLTSINMERQLDIRVITYENNQNKEKDREIRFDLGGIMVINDKSCKGLEFDYVFVADIDQIPVSLENETDIIHKQKLLYVVTTRAKNRVIFLRQSNVESNIENILPNTEILERKYEQSK